jgi:two-component system OmpR family response regulator
MNSDPVRSVLLVDDDQSLLHLLMATLQRAGYRVLSAKDTAVADACLASEPVDLLVLDVDMPGETGLQFLVRLRTVHTLPVLMLSGLARESDRVRGLDAGADDYLVKPFGADELLARVRALLRRLPAEDPELHFGHWTFCTRSLRLTRDGQEVELPAALRALLKALAEHPGQTLSREQLLSLVGDPHGERFERAMDVRMSRLRTLLGDGDDGRPRWLHTVRGQGYRFDPECAAHSISDSGRGGG